MANRYGNVTKTIAEYEPLTICEIGTFSGRRAISMLLAALKYNNGVSYIGYDLFEEASDETDTEEFNGKTTRTEVSKVKEVIENKVTRKVRKNKNGDFEVELVKGNTNDVLRKGKYDFVYIDGGHHIDTIRHDYSKVRRSKVIIFDDYYDCDDKDLLAKRTEKFGCNNLIHELMEDQELQVSIMPLYDTSGEFYTKQVLVIRK
jgi:hypothetical protein